MKKQLALVSLWSAGLAFQGRMPAAVAPAPSHAVLLTGTELRVRLNQAIDTRRNRAGDRFTATLDEPLVSGDRVVVPKGATVSGHLAEAKASGRLKGRAMLSLRLDSLEFHGRRYAIQSATSRVSRGHKKHNLLWIGGTSGSGALVGAVVAGGPAAWIGAGAGAAAGTVAAAVTGKRQIHLPVESRVTFVLRSNLSIGG